ncbi:hypothetical protein Pa4123_40630 [Phytohabitans aurantiacus]|uniref:Secreted protein n=1 Tax=Phytohabitans aurantiacus TaxID=3016789 RepID=A0ABQ5QW37_9ACTN|nr:hypothetical protein Pa4123_40630 [Phytohabitans aurantiacus]
MVPTLTRACSTAVTALLIPQAADLTTTPECARNGWEGRPLGRRGGAAPIKAVCIDQGRMHAEKRSNHVHSPLIGGERGARRARRRGEHGRAGSTAAWGRAPGARGRALRVEAG